MPTYDHEQSLSAWILPPIRQAKQSAAAESFSSSDLMRARVAKRAIPIGEAQQTCSVSAYSTTDAALTVAALIASSIRWLSAKYAMRVAPESITSASGTDEIFVSSAGLKSILLNFVGVLPSGPSCRP